VADITTHSGAVNRDRCSLLQLCTWTSASALRLEAALRASEERWRAVFENTAAGIVTNNFEHERYETANEAFQRMTGTAGTSCEILRCWILLPRRSGSSAKSVLMNRCGPRRSYRIEKRYRRKDGKVVWATSIRFVFPATG